MPTAVNLPGFIQPGCLYLVSEAKGRLQMGDWAWRQIRRRGLRVIHMGTRAYVLADDLIEHFKQRAEQSA